MEHRSRCNGLGLQNLGVGQCQQVAAVEAVVLAQGADVGRDGVFHGVIFRRDQKASRFPGFAVLKLNRIGLGEKEQQRIFIKCNNCS